jgi:hypothetical protein
MRGVIISFVTAVWLFCPGVTFGGGNKEPSAVDTVGMAMTVLESSSCSTELAQTQSGLCREDEEFASGSRPDLFGPKPYRQHRLENHFRIGEPGGVRRYAPHYGNSRRSLDVAEKIARGNPYIASIRVYEIMTK